MRNKTITCCILLLCSSVIIAYGQSGKSYEKQKEAGFVFIEDAFDHSFLKYIKTFQCVSKEGDDIPGLLRAIRLQAEGLGANCFKFKSFTRVDSIKSMILTLDTYFADDRQLGLNSQLHEKNVVYIFSNDKFDDKTYSFQVDEEKVILKSGYFYKISIPVDSEVKINNGGFTGTTVKVKWNKDNPVRFFTLTGFAVADTRHQPSSGLGIGFTTGKINYISTNLGLLLSKTLKQQ